MEDLITVYGEALLSYVLALDDVTPDVVLTDAQSQVVEQLREFLTMMDGQESLPRALNLMGLFLAYVPEHDTTLANQMRIECGGEVAQPEAAGDAVAAELLTLARDFYPGFLIRQPTLYPCPPVALPSAFTIPHPATARLQCSILADEQLGQFYPGSPSGLTPADTTKLAAVSTYVIVSSGHSGGLQLPFFPDHFLSTAYDRLVLSGESDLGSYLSTMLAVLDDMRQLATKQSVDVPVVVGLFNVQMAEGDRIDLPNGYMRKVCASDSRWIWPTGPQPTVLLVTTTPLKVLSIKWLADVDRNKKFDTYYPHFDRARNQLQRTVNLMRFALLLAADEAPYPAALESMSRILDPLYGVGMSTGASQMFSPAQETTVELASFAAVETWAQRIQQHPAGLDVAMRRLLSAATSRTDPLDGLIDAVLAWENMFSGTPETNLRVCGAIALLLEPESYEERKILFKELKALYTARSGLVHGSKEPNLSDAAKMRDRAVEIGLESMKRLYDFPDLLQLADSSERSGNILLGATR